MHIEKRSGSSYRIRQMVDGIVYSVTVPYKPSKKEAYTLIQDKITGRDKLKLTFDQAAKQYTDSRRNTISPATVRSYESIRNNIPDEFKNKRLMDINALDVQKYINDLSADHSPKTVRNHHGFISSVLSSFAPDIVLRTQLPQRKKIEKYLPPDEDIQAILEYAAGSDYEIALRLACYGLRRSEICALTIADLEGNLIHINKALVENAKNKWTLKETKTTDSTRTVYIDDALRNLIHERGEIYSKYPESLYDYLQTAQKELKIKKFSLHTLRHYYASNAHAMGIPDEVIMASGGWKTDHVMKNVYRHEKKSQVEELQKRYAESMGKYGQKNLLNISSVC